MEVEEEEAGAASDSTLFSFTLEGIICGEAGAAVVVVLTWPGP